MPTNLKIVPRLLSFAAATFVLLAGVSADARPPATSSAVDQPIPPGQARIWIYSAPEQISPANYHHMAAATFNGVKVGYEQAGEGFYRNVAPGHYIIAAARFLDLDRSQSATVDLAAGQEVYLKLDAIGWPDGWGQPLQSGILCPPHADANRSHCHHAARILERQLRTGPLHRQTRSPYRRKVSRCDAG